MKAIFGDNIRNPEIKEQNEPRIKTRREEITKAQEKIYEAKIVAYVKEEKS